MALDGFSGHGSGSVVDLHYADGNRGCYVAGFGFDGTGALKPQIVPIATPDEPAREDRREASDKYELASDGAVVSIRGLAWNYSSEPKRVAVSAQALTGDALFAAMKVTHKVGPRDI